MKNSWLGSGLAGVALFGCVVVGSAYAADEMSQYREVERIQYSAKSKTVYFTAKPAGWGAVSCPNATYAYAVESETPGLNTLISLVMQAKATGSTVAFTGECTGGDYYKVHYVFAK
ncbi:hypothetical protein [Pseudomonas sp. HMWF032]|uniref:hypothetical protein n=1 Tax=Pseudomonas sp. HMWF032 TaxID=2056866 RepID=UPI0011B1E789|nr:hypothetical protein [Pseudomonas sp. HMWF032]